MSNGTINYTDEPIEAKVIDDFLPAPDQLVMKDDTVKVTLSLSRKSIDFFKAQADKNDVKYQVMIRSLLDHYSDHYQNPS